MILVASYNIMLTRHSICMLTRHSICMLTRHSIYMLTRHTIYLHALLQAASLRYAGYQVAFAITGLNINIDARYVCT